MDLSDNETINQAQIEIAFVDLVECAKNRFNGEFAFHGQDLLKGQIFPAKGITQYHRDILVVDSIAGGERLGETKFEMISDPDEDDDLTREAVIWAFEENKFTEIERDNWLRIARKHEQKIFKVMIKFAKKHLDPQKNFVAADWTRMCIIIQQEYIKVLAYLHGPTEMTLEKFYETVALFAKAFVWVKGVNAFEYNKLGEKIDEKRNNTHLESEL